MSRMAWLLCALAILLPVPGYAGWTNVSGYASPTIRSERVEPFATGSPESMAVYTGIGWTANQYAYTTVVSATTSARVLAVLLRGTSASRTDYECQIHGPLGASTPLYIYRVNSGAATLLASTTATVASTDVMRCEATGTTPTTIKQYINGVERLSFSDGTPIASGSPGLMVYSNGATSDTQIDTWGAGNTGGGDLATDLFTRGNGPLDTGTCTGGSPTWNAQSAERTAVLDCVTAASSGDTINVPAGSATWATSISLTTKNLILKGAGNGSDAGSNTVITGTGVGSDSNTNCFVIGLNGTSSSSRVTRFRFINCTVLTYGLDGTKTFRIDHNYFQGTTDRYFTVGGYTDLLPPRGVIDNNTFEKARFVIMGTLGTMNDGNFQHTLWSLDPDFGGPAGVYIEDNVITSGPAATDCNHGGRYIFRFNTVTTSAFYVNEVHGVQGLNRACQRWEIYGNN